MRDPYNDESNAIFRRLGLKLLLGHIILLFERAVSSYWLLFTWCCLFGSLWVSNLLPYSQSFTFFLVSFIFYFGFLFLLRTGWKSFYIPKHAEVYRRMETSSRQRHRPTDFFYDTPANAKNKTASLLWSLQARSWLQSLPKLRLASSKPIMLYKDPYGICFVAFTLLFFSFVVGGSSSFSRLQNGLFPIVPMIKANLEEKLVTVRIIPPEYTRMGETELSGQGYYKDTIKIPEGSLVKVVIREQSFEPSLLFGGKTFSLERDTENQNTYVTEISVSEQPNGLFNIKGLFFNIFRFSYEIIQDEPPSVSLDGSIETLKNGTFQIPLLVSDDYGITEVRLSISKDPAIFDYPMGKPYSVVRSLYAGAKNVEEPVKPVFDLAAHTWAGLPVMINIDVRDHSGHVVKLDPINFTMPERSFSNPVAKYIIEQRQRLAWAPIGSAAAVSADLENLVFQPELLKGDKVAFLALRLSASRLYYSPTIESAEAVIPLLWKVALKLEDGDIAVLLDELRQIQQDLENALRDPNTPDEKIAELTQKLQQKMMEYMQALVQRMNNPRSVDRDMPISSEMLMEMLDTSALNEFLSEMAERALHGERDKAQQMLSEFQQLMDSLNSPESMQMPQDVEAMMETLNGLQDLIQEQKELLDLTREDLNKSDGAYGSGEPNYGDTELENAPSSDMEMGELPPMPSAPGESGNQTQPGGDRPGGTSGNQSTGKDGMNGSGNNGNLLGKQRAGAQQKIKNGLIQLSNEYSQKSGQGAPNNMNAAQRSMDMSEQSLYKGNGQASIPHQEQAIEDLQESMKQLSQQLQQRLQNMTMLTLGGTSSGKSGESDGPFGMRNIEIPEGSERHRIDEIIDLLRDKSGEWDRPPEERDYYKRLLRKF